MCLFLFKRGASGHTPDPVQLESCLLRCPSKVRPPSLCLDYTDRVPNYVCSRWSTQCASRTFPRRKSFSWIRRMIPKGLKRTKLPPRDLALKQESALAYVMLTLGW